MPPRSYTLNGAILARFISLQMIALFIYNIFPWINHELKLPQNTVETPEHPQSTKLMNDASILSSADSMLLFDIKKM